mmetsp:Transcript_36509/g.56049  ORF Transcript_36509/g.56049 Transcript_36509/m.56049 type:complete len:88 (+) Transcript_36509:2848-3111(+)
MFDIIFMDCNMPFKDGPTASKEIREYIDLKSKEKRESNMGKHSSTYLNYRQPLIIAVTGHTEDMYIKAALDNGMDQVVAKPATTRKI